ncbi:MAG: MFS transporter, partial [Acidimicrobiia bacterium]
GLWVLVALRTAQGVAVAGVFPNGWALLRAAVPPDRLARSFALVGMVITTGVALGPPLAGLAVEIADWRAIFAVNLAVAGPALVAAVRLPVTTRPVHAHRFDFPGALAWSALLVAVAALLNRSTGPSGLLILTLGLVPLGVAGYLFVRRELRHPDPVVQPRFFADGAFTAANLCVGFSNLAWYLMFIVVPLALDDRPGVSSFVSGLVLAVAAAPIIVLGPLGGRLSDTRGRRMPAAAGTAALVGGLVLLTVVGTGASVPVLLVAMVVTGAGLALSSASMQTVALEAVPEAQSGAASGVYSTSRYLGSIIGSSLLAAAGDPTGRGMLAVMLAAAVVAAASTTRFPAMRQPVARGA